MAVPIFLRRLRLCKMHMSAVPNVDCAAGAPLEFVEVALVEIGAEAYLMHVVSVAQRDGLAAYRCKAVIMRVGIRPQSARCPQSHGRDAAAGCHSRTYSRN